MTSISRRSRTFIGLLILCTGGVVISHELGLLDRAGPLLVAPVVLVVLMLTIHGTWSRRVFTLLALILSAMNLAWNPSWSETLLNGITTAAFIASFFSALTTLRFTAATSPAIRRCGEFLSRQPPGRRYLALTVGGQLFGLLLNYGAIQLLGAMSVANVGREMDVELRKIRVRRMLLAIQRGFISILPWSPFSFAIVISTTLVPGASWSQAALPGAVSGLLLATTGWLLDRLLKPRSTAAIALRPGERDSWLSLMPLFTLLAMLAVILTVIHLLTGVRVLVLVMLVTPLLSVVWIGVQTAGRRPLRHVKRRVNNYLFVQLADLRSEMLLLMMAGYIGTVASPLLSAALLQLGLDPVGLPAWIMLVSIVWLIPIAGQFGMNPILVAALIAPVLPEASTMGVTPAAIVTALTAGWMLSGVSSPFTATTLLTGVFGGVSAAYVGQRWNGAFTLLCALALSVWVIVYSGQLS